MGRGREEQPQRPKRKSTLQRTEQNPLGVALKRQTVDTRAGRLGNCTGVQKGQGVGDSLGVPKRGVIMALKDEQEVSPGPPGR